MSSLGILLILLAVWLILNADKLAWVFMGNLKLNNRGFERWKPASDPQPDPSNTSPNRNDDRQNG